MSELTRRSFFAGAAAAASASRVLGANDRIRVGIVGLGGRGQDHLNFYLRIPSAEVTALCDVNQAARERGQAKISASSRPKAKEIIDMRDLYSSRECDAVSIATPNHWHALATIWAVQNGKDVYCEKPATHNIYEGDRMVEEARKHGRIVQIGQQSRSTPHKVKAMKLLQEGAIGPLYLARALCFKRRKSILKTPVEPVPPGLDWDRFLGPAPMRPYTKNRFAYNWHWFWDTGNGDIGNQGVHEMDIARWGMGGLGYPKSVTSSGGKFVYDDDQETPNTQLATLDYGHAQIVFDVRGLLTGPEAGLPVRGGNTVGNLFYGADGWMWVDSDRFRIYKGEGNQKVMEEEDAPDENASILHMENFLAACRSRRHTDLTCDVAVGAVSAALCHFANIAYRCGRRLEWDPEAKRFANDAEANALMTREYRRPYVV